MIIVQQSPETLAALHRHSGPDGWVFDGGEMELRNAGSSIWLRASTLTDPEDHEFEIDSTTSLVHADTQR